MPTDVSMPMLWALSSDEFALVLQILAFAIAMPLLGWMVTTVARERRRARESEHRAILKQQMLDRGISADDIKTVLEAGQPAVGEAKRARQAT